MYNDDSSSAAAAVAFFLILIPLFLFLVLVGYVLSAFFLMKIFEKAGVQGKWRAWVPVYNSLIFAKLGDFNPWVFLGTIVASGILSNIPFLGFIFALLPLAAMVMIGWRVGAKLNKEWYYMLLWLLGIGIYIWYGILAFTKNRWNPAIAPSPWAGSFLADKTVWEGVPVQPSNGAVAAPGYAASAPGAYPPAGHDAPAPGAYPPAPPAGTVPPAPPAGTVPPAPPAPQDPDAPRV